MTSIEALGESIAKNSKIVNEWLAKNNIPSPSFAQDSDAEFPSTSGAPEIEAARLTVIEDANTLRDLLLGPGEVLRNVCWGSIDNSVQQCIYHFNILQAIPLDGTSTYDEIAAKVRLSEPQVKALVRQSALNRILHECKGGDHVEHTASSALLLRDPVMMDWYGHCVEEMFPAGGRLAQALEKYHGSTNQGDSAFGLAFDTKGNPIYTFFEQHPKQQARFFGAMEGVGRDPGHDLMHIVTGYDWAKVGNSATVVDVGGSSGFLSIALAKAHANLKKLVVQDYKHTVEEGAARLPKELVGRVDFVPHNFFDPQPTREADVYMMRHICHNWSTEKCADIIRQIIPAMKPGSRILLIEVVVLPSNMENSKISETYMRNVDVTMLQMLNTQERSASEWEDVVRAVGNSRLSLVQIVRPKGSWDSIIEISLRDESNRTK